MRRVERIARFCISAGGVGTILAVTLIFVFLLWVVAPLFGRARTEERATLALRQAGPVLAADLDDYGRMLWVLHRDGVVRALRASDGSPLRETRLFDRSEATCWTFLPNGVGAAFGYGDGTLRTARLRFSVEFLDAEALPEELRGMEPGDVRAYLDGLVEVTPEKQWRFLRLAADLDEPLKAGDEAIRLLDFSNTPSARAYGVLFASGHLAALREKTIENWATGEITKTLEEVVLPYTPPAGRGEPDHLVLSGVGTHLFLIWKDGFLIRYDVSNPDQPVEAETARLLPDGAEITALRTLVGKSTIVVGDSKGRVQAIFPTKPEGAGTVDGAVTVAAHLFGADGEAVDVRDRDEVDEAFAMEGPAVTSIGPSRRSRLIAVGYADGSARLLHVTSEALLWEGRIEAGPVAAARIAPKEDGLLVLGPREARIWGLRPGHPEATLHAMFRPVWYEGYAEPDHTWQSTGGTDDFEPKLGMWPLVFGTLKATLYSILMGAPIALLAALYTSEFMASRWRASVKSAIEMMAGLPSVVLGFLAALVIAPFVQDVVPGVLLALVLVPLAFLLGARLWQLLPVEKAIRWSGLPRILSILALLVGAIALASLLGPAFERAYFHGDIKQWLSRHEFGGGTGGWAFLLLPLCGAGLVVLVAVGLGPWIRRISADWTRMQCALFDIGRFVVLVLLAFGLSWLLGLLLYNGLGWDARGGIFDTYAQRNALIVGFVMGFAIVPILYTLAEDALRSVPQQLREGSLGSGATPWQTATRIVIPAAMSGLFGALMVGLGRAVGETMIVLMAAGNTPILDLNIFEGFRTLSANIATELPEAPRDTTHYRTLFLAALVLFCMTFLINTLAEMVRRTFRKRFAEL